MRSLDTWGIWIQTSAGEVVGELWSDRLLALATDVKDAEVKGVAGPDDVAEAFMALDVPDDEARRLADHLWRNDLASFASRFAGPS